MRFPSAPISLLAGPVGPWALAAAVLLFTGCIFPTRTVVNRFSGEFVCPQAQIHVEKMTPDHYRATGCNRRANYRCTGEYGEFCERIGQPETIAQPQEAPPPGGEPAQPSEG